MKPINLFSGVLFFCFFLLLIPSSAAAVDGEEIIHVQCQDIGLITQNIVIFDQDGNDVIHSNSSGTFYLDGNASRFYTFQLQPAMTTVESETLLQTFFNMILNNWMAVFLLVALVYAIAKR